MRDLPIRIEAMPPCLCKSKVIGYEYSEDGFDITHCACGGVISCAESEDFEIKKPFDIAKHEFSDTDIECELADGNNLLLINNTGYNCIPFNKSDAIAIAKALGVTAEDLK